MKKIFLLALILVNCSLSKAQTQGSFIDARDGKNYATVTYTLLLPDSLISDIDEYKTYETKSPSSYEIRINDSLPTSMTWMAENLNFESIESKCFKDTDENCAQYGRLYTWTISQNVCPNGWHLPTDDEWFLLASQYEGVALAGKHLKSNTLGGTNKSLFNIKKPSIYWSSSEMNQEYAWDWKVNFRWEKLQRWKGGKNAYNLVRCVEDY